MAMEIKPIHPSPKQDDTDLPDDILKPSQYNAGSKLTQSAPGILGRTADGAGPSSELTAAETVAFLKSGGIVTYNGTGIIAANGVATDGDEIILEQTGDQYGATQLILRNRNNALGPIFKNVDLDVVDFGFDVKSGASSVIRYEHRAARIIGGPDSGVGEFQFNDTDANRLYFTTNRNATLVRYGRLGVGTDNPQYKLDVAGDIAINGQPLDQIFLSLVGGVLTGPLTHGPVNLGTATSGTLTIDADQSNWFEVVIDGNVTLEFTNMVAGRAVTLEIDYQSGSISDGDSASWKPGNKTLADVAPDLVSGSPYSVVASVSKGYQVRTIA